MIRTTIISLLLTFCVTYIMAQNENATSTLDVQETVSPNIQPIVNLKTEVLDSLHLPELTSHGQMPIMHPLYYTSYWGSWGTWGLHKGINVSLDASVFASFGKNAYHHAGFAQSVSAMYAIPVTGKLSLAAGGFFNNVNWGRFNSRNAGVSAILGYQFDEHWEGYLYAHKQLLTNMPRMPYPMYDLMYDHAELRDRIGAAIKYNFSPSFSVQVSFERNSR